MHKQSRKSTTALSFLRLIAPVITADWPGVDWSHHMQFAGGDFTLGHGGGRCDDLQSGVPSLGNISRNPAFKHYERLNTKVLRAINARCRLVHLPLVLGLVETYSLPGVGRLLVRAAHPSW